MMLQLQRPSRQCPSHLGRAWQRPQRPAAARPAAAQGTQSGGAAAPTTPPTSGTGTVTVLFKGAQVVTEAQPGENLLEVAERCGISLPAGCHQGNCGICEVDVVKVDAQGVAGAPAVVRTCIAGVPPGFARLEIDEVMEDGIWGVDGYDT